jgi:hypothetical protein
MLLYMWGMVMYLTSSFQVFSDLDDWQTISPCIPNTTLDDRNIARRCQHQTMHTAFEVWCLILVACNRCMARGPRKPTNVRQSNDYSPYHCIIKVFLRHTGFCERIFCNILFNYVTNLSLGASFLRIVSQSPLVFEKLYYPYVWLFYRNVENFQHSF